MGARTPLKKYGAVHWQGSVGVGTGRLTCRVGGGACSSALAVVLWGQADSRAMSEEVLAPLHLRLSCGRPVVCHVAVVCLPLGVG